MMLKQRNKLAWPTLPPSLALLSLFAVALSGFLSEQYQSRPAK